MKHELSHNENILGVILKCNTSSETLILSTTVPWYRCQKHDLIFLTRDVQKYTPSFYILTILLRSHGEMGIPKKETVTQ